jgi:hypothetical protein
LGRNKEASLAGMAAKVKDKVDGIRVAKRRCEHDVSAD